MNYSDLLPNEEEVKDILSKQPNLSHQSFDTTAKTSWG